MKEIRKSRGPKGLAGEGEKERVRRADSEETTTEQNGTCEELGYCLPTCGN